MSQQSVSIQIEEVKALAANALIAASTAPGTAMRVADALVAAEIDGQGGHGLMRVVSYAAQARSGKVDGHAVPSKQNLAAGYIKVDAGHGFAYPALELAVDAVSEAAGAQGIAFAAVRRSHHAGQCGRWVELLARRGCIGIMAANTPSAMAPHGGNSAIFGTNPLAFAAPRREGPPIVIDLSLSTAARGKIVAAARDGRSIPEGWALDRLGQPTTDPKAALEGSLLPVGGAKGSALALMVEILAVSLTGAVPSSEASSFFEADGKQPGTGQALIAIDLRASAGEAVFDRVEALASSIETMEGTRLPGAQRDARRAAAERDGLSVNASLLEELRSLAGVY